MFITILSLVCCSEILKFLKTQATTWFHSWSALWVSTELIQDNRSWDSSTLVPRYRSHALRIDLLKSSVTVSQNVIPFWLVVTIPQSNLYRTKSVHKVSAEWHFIHWSWRIWGLQSVLSGLVAGVNLTCVPHEGLRKYLAGILLVPECSVRSVPRYNPRGHC
jgi:hypothetical protein